MLPVIVVGNTLEFEKTFDGYDPNDGWVATYELVNAEQQIGFQSLPADINSSKFSFKQTATETGAWIAGDYNFRCTVFNDPDRYTVEEGTIEIQPAYTDPIDDRSHVKKVLDALEATIEGKATKDQLSYSISNRSLSRMSPSELLDWYDRYKQKYNQELAKENPASRHNIVQVEFPA